MISPRPDITITEIGKEDEFLVIGCDGVWERFSSADCAIFVHDMSHGDVTSPRRRSFLKHSMPLTETSCEGIAKQICVTTVRKPYEFPGMPVGVTIGCDNMSVIVVRLTNELLDAIPQDKPAPELGVTLPVISYGAQVPDDWKPSSGRSSPATPGIPGKRKRGPKPKKKTPPDSQTSSDSINDI
jgi:serine/threonine protein phosphatase PrpC